MFGGSGSGGRGSQSLSHSHSHSQSPSYYQSMSGASAGRGANGADDPYDVPGKYDADGNGQSVDAATGGLGAWHAGFANGSSNDSDITEGRNDSGRSRAWTSGADADAATQTRRQTQQRLHQSPLSAPSRETPFQRHMRAMRAARGAWDELVDDPRSLRTIPADELSTWVRCRTITAPMTALPFSAALGFLAYSFVTSFAVRKPNVAWLQLAARARMPIAVGVAGTHLALASRRSSDFCEPCYMHALAADNEAAAAMRDAYRAVYPGSAFLAVADDIATHLGGRATGAPIVAGGQSHSYPRVDYESRVRTLLPVRAPPVAFVAVWSCSFPKHIPAARGCPFVLFSCCRTAHQRRLYHPCTAATLTLQYIPDPTVAADASTLPQVPQLPQMPLFPRRQAYAAPAEPGTRADTAQAHEEGVDELDERALYDETDPYAKPGAKNGSSSGGSTARRASSFFSKRLHSPPRSDGNASPATVTATADGGASETNGSLAAYGFNVDQPLQPGASGDVVRQRSAYGEHQRDQRLHGLAPAQQSGYFGSGASSQNRSTARVENEELLPSWEARRRRRERLQDDMRNE